MDIHIKEYFNEKIESRVDSRVSKNMSDDEIQRIKTDAFNEFSLDIWLPNAAKRAKQLSLVTHNGKLTHTGVKKESSVFIKCTGSNDGYLRSGNTVVDNDVIGNSAALDVYKFLSIKVSDGKTVLQHLEQDTPFIRKEFDITTATFEEISKGLLEILKNSDDAYSSDRLKQVYFPVDDDYHLLSLLTPSGIVYKLKEKITLMKFSDSSKTAREDKKNNKHNKDGYSDILNLTVIGFGGTKPQNAGNLSNQNGGKAYLLNSMPPSFSNRNINPPRKGFFNDFIRFKFFQDDFKTLYQILEVDKRNNIDIRNRRDRLFSNIVSKVVYLLMQLRELEPGWSESDYYTNLNQHEIVWLDNLHSSKRSENEKYFPYIKNELLRWIARTYSWQNKNKKLAIPQDDLKHLKGIINEQEEWLR